MQKKSPLFKKNYIMHLSAFKGQEETLSYYYYYTHNKISQAYPCNILYRWSVGMMGYLCKMVLSRVHLILCHKKLWRSKVERKAALHCPRLQVPVELLWPPFVLFLVHWQYILINSSHPSVLRWIFDLSFPLFHFLKCLCVLGKFSQVLLCSWVLIVCSLPERHFAVFCLSVYFWPCLPCSLVWT